MGGSQVLKQTVNRINFCLVGVKKKFGELVLGNFNAQFKNKKIKVTMRK